MSLPQIAVDDQTPNDFLWGWSRRDIRMFDVSTSVSFDARPQPANSHVSLLSCDWVGLSVAVSFMADACRNAVGRCIADRKGTVHVSAAPKSVHRACLRFLGGAVRLAVGTGLWLVEAAVVSAVLALPIAWLAR